jgi:hypothetical protein
VRRKGLEQLIQLMQLEDLDCVPALIGNGPQEATLRGSPAAERGRSA